MLMRRDRMEPENVRQQVGNRQSASVLNIYREAGEAQDVDSILYEGMGEEGAEEDAGTDAVRDDEDDAETVAGSDEDDAETVT